MTQFNPTHPKKKIPYGRQTIEADDIQAVVEVLESDWLTCGPIVDTFEKQFAKYTHAAHAVGVSNGTAALHAAMYAIGIQPQDEVIVPAITFVATANAVVYQGGRPVFADVDPHTLLIDPSSIEKNITSKTKAIIAVDFAGQPCDYDTLRKIADRHRLILIADGCHALGATYLGKSVGSIADLTTFSFHPVKHITTGEGGMITTDREDYAKKMKLFRNHGISSDFRTRGETGTWFYEMQDLGFNYRITDLQCALGSSQLRKCNSWLAHRRHLATRYDVAFSHFEAFRPLAKTLHTEHAYHLYVISLQPHLSPVTRDKLFSLLREEGIGVNVHYIPVHLQPYYQERFGTHKGQCPMAEKTYENILSLPLYQGMSEADQDRIIYKLQQIFKGSTLHETSGIPSLSP